MKFTSKERDSETGLDYFGARYMSSAQGRFTSPDVPLLDQREDDPQSWNLYSYGRNNPLRYTDPTGNCTVDGEQHFGSCIWHTLGFYQTQKEQAAAVQKEADADRAAMAQWHGFSIGGQNPADIAKSGNNQQVIGAYKSGMNFLTGVAMQSLSPCPAGVSCGVIPIGPPGELPLVAGTASRVETALQNITKGVQQYSRDGITFANREGILPAQPLGYYKEYTVPPTAGVANRGSERELPGRS